MLRTIRAKLPGAPPEPPPVGPPRTGRLRRTYHSMLPIIIAMAESASWLDNLVAAAWAPDNEARAARTFAMVIKLREALFGIFSAIGAAEACDRCDFLIFSAALARAPQRCQLVPMQRRFAWSISRTRNPVRDAMTPVLRSAADLMLGAASHRIRRCANEECLWLFLDQSKTNTRR